MTDEPTGNPAPPDRGVLSAEELRQIESSTRTAMKWQAWSIIIRQVLMWALTILTARVLTPTDYGIMALTEGVFPYLHMLTTLRLDPWMIRHKDFSEKTQEALLTFFLILGITAMVASWAAAPVVARLYGQSEAYGIFWSFSILFVVKALQIIPEVRLRRELNLKAMAIQGVVIQVSRGVLQLVLALCGFGFWSLVIGQVFADVSTLIGIIWVAGMPRRFGWDSKLYREAFRFGGSATGSTVFSVISSTADNVIVGILFGMETLGFYGMAFYLTEQPASKLNMMISPVLSPLYSKLKDDFSAINRTYLKITRVTVLFLAPVLLGMAVTAPEAVVLIMGQKWQPMVHLFQALSVVALLRVLSANASTVLFARGEPDRVLLVSGLVVLVHPPLFYILGKHFGMNGILFVWLAIFPLVGVGAWLWMIRRSTGLPILTFLKEISPGIAAATLMVGACFAVRELVPSAATPAVLLLIQIAIGAASYSLLLKLFWPKSFDEIIGFARKRD